MLDGDAKEEDPKVDLEAATLAALAWGSSALSLCQIDSTSANEASPSATVAEDFSSALQLGQGLEKGHDLDASSAVQCKVQSSAESTDPALQVLVREVEELQSALAQFGEKVAEECRAAAEHEAARVRQHFSQELCEAEEQGRSLEEEAAQEELQLKKQRRRLSEVERRLRAAEQRAESIRGEELSEEAELAEVESHLELVAALKIKFESAACEVHAQLGMLLEEDSQVVSRLQERLAETNEELLHRQERLKELQELEASEKDLAEELRLCDGRLEDLQAVATQLTGYLAEQSSLLDRLQVEQQSLCQATRPLGYNLTERLESSLAHEARLRKELERQEEEAQEAAVRRQMEEELRAAEEAKMREAERCRQECQDLEAQLRALEVEAAEERNQAAHFQEEVGAMRLELEEEEHRLAVSLARRQGKEERRLKQGLGVEVRLGILRARLAARERRVQLCARRLVALRGSSAGGRCQTVDSLTNKLSSAEEQEDWSSEGRPSQPWLTTHHRLLRTN